MATTLCGDRELLALWAGRFTLSVISVAQHPASSMDKPLLMLCRPAEEPGDTDAGRRLLEHAGRSSRALGSPRLSVRLIDYEVQQCPCEPHQDTHTLNII